MLGAPVLGPLSASVSRKTTENYSSVWAPVTHKGGRHNGLLGSASISPGWCDHLRSMLVDRRYCLLSFLLSVTLPYKYINRSFKNDALLMDVLKS